MQDTIFLVRGLERLLIVAGGFFCFWLCFKFQQIDQQSDGRFKWDKASVELKKIGPSVFFALFGAGLLAFALMRPAEFTVTAGSSATTSAIYRYLANDSRLQARLKDLRRDLQQASSFSRGVREKLFTEAERTELAQLLDRLGEYRMSLFDAAFGEGSHVQYQDYINRCKGPPSPQCEALQARIGVERLEQMERFDGS